MPLSRRPRDLSFTLKASAALALAVVADLLFWGHDIGSTQGAFALLLTLAATALHPAARRDVKAGWALVAATGLAIVLAWAPGPMAWMLFWAMLSLAVLLPRAARFDDAWRWSQRLVAQAAVGLFGPWLDLGRARKAGRTTQDLELARRRAAAGPAGGRRRDLPGPVRRRQSGDRHGPVDPAAAAPQPRPVLASGSSGWRRRPWPGACCVRAAAASCRRARPVLSSTWPGSRSPR
jgi:hypothetical protein